MKAQLCPVCNGTGKYQDRSGNVPDTTLTVTFRDCHGCGGKGWVQVDGDSPAIAYFYPRYFNPACPGNGWVDEYGIWHSGY